MHWLALRTDAYVLFKSWKTSSTEGLVAAMVAACACACLYEWLRFCLTSWDTRHRAHRTKDNNSIVVFFLRLWRSCLQCVGATGSYVIMLFLMTFDVYVFLATLLGVGVGFFFFAPLFTQREIGGSESTVEGKVGSDGYALYVRPTAKEDSPSDNVVSPLLTSLPGTVSRGSDDKEHLYTHLLEDDATHV